MQVAHQQHQADRHYDQVPRSRLNFLPLEEQTMSLWVGRVSSLASSSKVLSSSGQAGSATRHARCHRGERCILDPAQPQIAFPVQRSSRSWILPPAGPAAVEMTGGASGSAHPWSCCGSTGQAWWGRAWRSLSADWVAVRVTFLQLEERRGEEDKREGWREELVGCGERLGNPHHLLWSPFLHLQLQQKFNYL